MKFIHFLESLKTNDNTFLIESIKEGYSIINESGLSRIYQTLNSELPYAIITAFRKENDYNANVQLNKQLQQDIRGLGLSYKRASGEWVENGNTPVKEASMIVQMPQDWDEETFRKTMSGLGDKYKQDAITYKSGNSNKPVFIGQGEVSDYGLKSTFGRKQPEGATGEYKKPSSERLSPARRYSFPSEES